MILGISEDFTSIIELDSQLKSIPSSGLFLNTGVHPSITVENLLSFLPKIDLTFSAWDNSVTYGVFLTSRNRNDIVFHNNKIYESIKVGLNQDPATEEAYWVETNIESLRIKLFIESVKDRVLSDLSLNKRLVNNAYIYENGDTAKTLPNDYAAWVIEPKGSDYVGFRINEVSVQKDGVTPVNLYVVNEGNLLETVQITPSNGKVSFQKTDINLSGKGRFYLAIDSTDVYVKGSSIDPLKFDGFVAYTSTGVGGAAQTATYTMQTLGIGLGINITAFLDANQYIENNLQDFGPFIRAVFEYMTFQMFQMNSNNRSNRAERIQMSDEILIAELKRTDADTVVKRYYDEKKKARMMLEKSFDTQLSQDDGKLKINVSSV